MDIIENFRIKKNKPITKTCQKQLRSFGFDNHRDLNNISYEFWKGRQFIGVILGEEDYDYIYIDTLLVNEKYRGKGNGRLIIDYIKSLYKYIAVESTAEVFIFYKKLNFRRKRKQECIYTNTIDMHWKR